MSGSVAVPAQPVVDEVAGTARLAGHLVDTVATTVEQAHRGIAHRVFSTLGPVGRGPAAVHDAVAGAAYGSVRVGARGLGWAAAGVARSTGGGIDRRPVSGHRLGALGLATVNGLLGDRLDGHADDVVVLLHLTHLGRPLPADVGGVVATLAERGAVTDRLVVFVHGLAETTAAWSWWPNAPDGTPVPTYGERLAEVGWTPLEVGYNTGLPVTASGTELAECLEALVDAWPVPVVEVALVGHSMGGLVAGAAVQVGHRAEATWFERLGHVVTLGTPHAGSWLARVAHRGAAASMRLPETRGLGAVLELRSAGIRDLTRGWRPDPIAADGALASLPDLVPHAQHHYVSASVRGPDHLLTRLVGDGLVHPRSADAPGRAAGGAANVVLRHHRGIGHLKLLHHAPLADDLVAWLSPAAPPATAPAS